MTKKYGPWLKILRYSKIGKKSLFPLRIALRFIELVQLTTDFSRFSSLNRLSRRLQALQSEAKPGSRPILTFDKDDIDTLDFVAASANLRSTIFGIETKSRFEIKREWPLPCGYIY